MRRFLLQLFQQLFPHRISIFIKAAVLWAVFQVNLLKMKNSLG